MAVFALTAANILVGATNWTGTAPGGVTTPSGTITTSTNISALVTQVELSLEADEIDYTNFASAGWRQKVSGLQMGTVSLTLNQDFDASVTDALFGLGGTVGFGSTAPLFMEIRPQTAARSATNPAYVLRFLNTSYTPLSGSVGDLASISLTFPTTGVVGRLTS